MIEAVGPPLQRWLLFSGTLLLVGAVAWRGFIAPQARFRLSRGALSFSSELPEITQMERRVAGVALGGCLALLLAWGGRLWVQLMEFRDPFAPLSEDLTYLVLETFWGSVWIAQGGVLLALFVGFLVLGRRAGRTSPPSPGLTPEGVPRRGPRRLELPLRWAVVGAGVGLLLLTLSLSSHAMSVPGSRMLAVVVDLLHTAAAGVWMGGLTFILLVSRDTAGSKAHRLLATQLPAFSPVALVSVGTVLCMGVLLSSFHVPEIPALWESQYGRTLGAKVGVALAVMALGFWNWRRGLPEILASDESGYESAAALRVWRAAALEVTLAVAVVLVTAILVATPVPPGAH